MHTGYGEHIKETPLGKSRHRWEDNTKISLKCVWWQDVDRIDKAEGREKCWAFVSTVMNIEVL